MKKVRWVSATAATALVAATFALPGAGVAYASGNGNVTGSGNSSLLSGNTVTVLISAPVNLCGVSLGVLGFANSDCQGGASANVSSPTGGAGNGSAGNGNVTGNGNVSTVSGNTISAPVSVPVNICGVSVAGGGVANSHCEGGARTRVTEPSGTSGPGNGNVTGHGNVSTVSGNTISAPVSAPVNICGVSLEVLGAANSGCEGGSFVHPSTPPSCEGNHCTRPSCECAPPPCEGDHCSPPPCESDSCARPSCQDNCTPPAGTRTPLQGTVPTATGPTGTGPTGTGPTGTGPTGTAVTAVTTATMPSSGLPTTGADLILLGLAALASIGVGAGAIAVARRYRPGEAS